MALIGIHATDVSTRAIRLGATKEELFEVLETCLVPGGAPTFHRGLSALLKVDDDESR